MPHAPKKIALAKLLFASAVFFGAWGNAPPAIINY